MRIALTAFGAIALAGCTATMSDRGQAVPDAAAVPPVACDASRAEAFVGRRGEAVAEEARTAAGAKAVRVIGPGQAVTMDYRPDRLNIETDAAGIAVKLRCG